MPVPDLPQALSTGVVDGALVPFEVMPPLKLHEMTERSVEGPGGTRFGAATFLLAMNKERYDALPDDLKKVIDDNSNAAIAQEIGKAWDEVEEPGKAMQRDSGGVVVQLTPEGKASFDDRSAAVVDRWIEDVSGRRRPGASRRRPRGRRDALRVRRRKRVRRP